MRLNRVFGNWILLISIVLASSVCSMAQERLHIAHRYQNIDSQSLIGLPMGDHKTIIDKKGNLHWSQWSLANKGPDVTFGFSNQLDGELSIELATNSSDGHKIPLEVVRQDLDQQRFPFVVTHLQSGSLLTEETAFAVSAGGLGLDVVCVSVTNQSDAEANLEIRLSGKSRNLPAHVNGSLLATREGLLLAAIEPAMDASDISTEAEGLVLIEHRKISAHGSATFWIKIPYDLPSGKQSSIPKTDGQQLLALARKDWERFWNQGTQMELPTREQELSDFYLSSVAYVFILTERDAKGELWALDGPAEYREFWGRGEYFQSRAMQVAGFPKIAEDSITHTFSLQKKDGEWDWPVTSGWPAWDNIGGDAGAIWDHYLFWRNKQWLAHAYPYLAKAADWIQFHREETEVTPDAPAAAQPIHRPVPSKCLDEPEPPLQAGEKKYWWGLLPWGYGDSGLPSGHPFPHNMWALYAMQVAQQAATELGKSEDAARFARLHDEYKAAILASMQRAIGLEKEDAPYLPAMPTYPDGGVSQSLIAVYPTNLFSANDLWISNLLKRIQRNELRGLPTEMGWMGRSGVWPGESMNMAETYLRRGNIDKTVDLLLTALEHSYTTNVWKEEIKVQKGLPVACKGGHAQDIENDHGSGDMPEAWANANLVLLLRDMLIREDHDQLYLLSGIPANWIQAGEHIAITSAPTTFGGRVSYRLDNLANGQMKLHLETSIALPTVVIRFPFAEGQNLQSVTINGHTVTTFEKNILTLKPVSKTIEIEAHIGNGN